MKAKFRNRLGRGKQILDASPIAPGDERYDDMLRNILRATGQPQAQASYAEMQLTMQAQRAKQRRRVQAGLGACAGAAVLALALWGLPGGPAADRVVIGEGVLPLASGHEPGDALPPYRAAVRTEDGEPADQDLLDSLRGMRRDEGTLYFYFESEDDEAAWRVLSATDRDGGDVGAQTVAAQRGLARYAYPDGGLDLLVENAQGQQALVSVRTLADLDGEDD